MPNNPIEVLKIALMIAVPVGIAALTTWINITIRFAPDAAHAMREAKQIVIKVAEWIGYIWMAGVLAWQFVSPSFNPRFSLLIIILYSFGLFHSYITWQFVRILDLMKQQSDHVLGLAEIMETYISAAKQIDVKTTESN